MATLDQIISGGSNSDPTAANLGTGNDIVTTDQGLNGDFVPLGQYNAGIGAYNLGTTNVTGNPTDAGGNAPITDVSTQAPTSGPNSPIGAGGSFMNSLTSGLGQFLGITDPGAQASLIPYLAQALQQYKDAGQYMDIAKQSSSIVNPFGPYRKQYADELSALEKDPSQIVNTPGYKFSLNQGLDSVGGKLAGMGLAGTDAERNQMLTEAQGLASKTYNDTISQLTDLSGARFGPGEAGNLLAAGMNNAVGARNAALAALAVPFGRQANSNNINPGSTTTNPGGAPVTSSGAGGMSNIPTNSSGMVDMTGFNTNPDNTFTGGIDWNSLNQSTFGNNGIDTSGTNFNNFDPNNTAAGNGLDLTNGAGDFSQFPFG